MNDIYLITIITPTFNSEKTIERTVLSVLNQSYTNIEYIVKDGGSSDKTIEIVKKYQSIFENSGKSLTLIVEKDKGIGDAFNRGIEISKGDYVGIINSDDWYEPDAIQLIVNSIDNHLVYCGDLKLWANNSFIKKRKSRLYLLPFGMYIMHPTVFVNRKLYNEFKFDTNLKIAMDFDLFLNITSKYRKTIKYIPKVIANMELGGASADLDEMHIEEELVMKRYHSNLLLCFIKFIKTVEKFIAERFRIHI